MANCKYVEDCKKVTENYFKEIHSLIDQKSKAPAEYAGDRLKTELQKLDSSASTAGETARWQLASLRDSAAQAYQNVKQIQLNGNLPDDIRLLSAPVTLTADELQTLADRHKDSYIMQRAIKEFGEKNKVHVNTAPSPDDQIQAAQDLCNHFNNYIGIGLEDAARNEHYFNLESGDEGCYADFDKTLG